ncbi:(2Fe-2S)-binding protein [Novosphingobium endophyticum]|uniref:(2Fe-2S)-binding protein n=2 Tax=Novosphingobium endophyticum TaxID=1955250 RepID=A0A916TQR9_9SPHN|nr:(2Fe-2S)-binding protein [Novosphingobium endophyticum]
MKVLKNAWYAATWSHDLDDEPLSRTFHEQPVVIYRGEGGKPIALYDACPHRFAPLSLGRVQGDRIKCGYHGLEFDRKGHCVLNPHGKGVIASALNVRSYPLAERYGMIWIWMGDPDRADEDKLPSLPILEDADFTWVHGRTFVNAHYELVIDNLLDLSHVEFLHPFLASDGNSSRTVFRAEQVGDRVNSYYDVRNEPITALFRLLWEGDEVEADLHAYMYWSAPSYLYLDTGMSAPGEDPSKAPRVPGIHLLTPETENSTHYFWAMGRNRLRDNVEISEMIREGTRNAFEHEDEPMICAVRSRMSSNDLFANKPALLPIDEGNVRARRVLSRLILEEEGNMARQAKV